MYDRDDQPYYHLSDEDVLPPYSPPDTEKKTQARRIFEKLWTNETVAGCVFAMDMGILQYNARIHDLRHAPHGLDIRCEGEQARTRYRLVTPRDQIDYETMSLKPVKAGENLRLL